MPTMRWHQTSARVLMHCSRPMRSYVPDCEPLVLARTGLSEIFGPVAQMPVPERLVSAVLSQDTSGAYLPRIPFDRRRSGLQSSSSLGEALFTVRMMLVPIAVLSTAVIMVTVWLLSHPTERFGSTTTLVAVDDAGSLRDGRTRARAGDRAQRQSKRRQDARRRTGIYHSRSFFSQQRQAVLPSIQN